MKSEIKDVKEYRPEATTLNEPQVPQYLTYHAQSSIAQSDTIE